jgi:hypothetical protein
LKSVRANSEQGDRISSNGNSVSWNDVSGNGGPGGSRGRQQQLAEGRHDWPNNGDGIKITGSSNRFPARPWTVTGNGIPVAGTSNKIKSNRRANSRRSGTRRRSNTAAATRATTEARERRAGTARHGGRQRRQQQGRRNQRPEDERTDEVPDFAQANTTCE